MSVFKWRHLSNFKAKIAKAILLFTRPLKLNPGFFFKKGNSVSKNYKSKRLKTTENEHIEKRRITRGRAQKIKGWGIVIFIFLFCL